MPQFEFYIDQKQITWNREMYKIEANSKDEAQTIAKQIYNKEIKHDIWDVQSVGYPENISLKENKGYSTKELYNNEFETILENGLYT